MLIAWPAPIPVGHDHGDLASRVSGQRMCSHLRCHHGGLANSDDWPIGWHWHWVFPSDGNVELGGEELLVHANQMVPEPRVVWLEPASVSRFECESMKHLFARPVVSSDAQRSVQHVAFLHSRQSLPALQGVVRC